MRNPAARFGLILAALAALAALGRPATAGEASGPEAAAAKAVLEASGVKAGLCLHLGCGRDGSAGLTAALAEGSDLLVHGLALDDAALGRTRAAIDSRGVAGRALAEKLAEKSLPYLPDLARLVVVEDLAALAAAGVSKDEVLRVLAPGGALCTLEGGKWTATVKPRPKDMDEWTHPHHGPDNNLVSADKALVFPIGYRWIEGVPMNMGGWASCRAVVVAGGRCFTISVNELGRKTRGGVLTARDAWSGLPLWRAECEAIYGGAELDWRNVWPLVATERRVYSTQKNVLTVFDAALGKVETTCPTKFTPKRLLLAGTSLVAACWEKSESKGGYEADDLRATWWPVGEGSVEAFDPETGKPQWTLPLAVLTMAASDGTLYLLTHKGNPPTERNLVAVELATGKEKWRVPHTAFGPEADIYLNLAGPGCAVLTRSRGKAAAFVVSAADGKILHSLPNVAARSIVGNELWCSDGRYDLKTGKKNPGPGVGGAHVGGIIGGCVPAIVVGGRYVTASRGGSYAELPESAGRQGKNLSYQGARGGCITGMVPANGMFYTAQNACACNPTQVGGFIAAGPCGELPGAAEFAAPRPVEKGPAFGAVEAPTAPAADEWPTYRQNSERSGGSSALAVPDGLKQLWKMQLVKPGVGLIGEAWLARMGMAQPLTGPVVAGGLVIVCGTNSGQVMAMNAESGAKAWTASLGGRIDSPPTVYKGLCLVGCHDGWVYALRAKDGVLAYRLRVAPRERRMVAYGQVGSVWPATGAVLVHDGTAYVTAGRSTRSDGGIALVAFKPETGEAVWARALGDDMANLNDALSVQNGELAWHHHRMELKTGKPLAPVQPIQYHGSMIDGSWLSGFGTRFGRCFMLGKACSNMMAWNDKLLAMPGLAVSRAKMEIPKPAKIGGIKNPDGFNKDEILWGTELEPATPWARPGTMAVTGNAVLYAGGVYTYCDSSKYAGSFLWIKSAADGKKLQPTVKLEAPPAYEGLAVAGGRVYLAMQDGTLICWGK